MYRYHLCRYLEILISILDTYIDTCVYKVGGFPSVDPKQLSYSSFRGKFDSSEAASCTHQSAGETDEEVSSGYCMHDAVIWQTLKQHRGKIVEIELKFNLYCDVLIFNRRFAEAFKFHTTGHIRFVQSQKNGQTQMYPACIQLSL